MSANRRRAVFANAPLWSWANLLSLDAVAVGLLWQFIFTLQFCHRSPTHFELVAISLAIWLVYTADRLFDSIRLDTGQPHSLRHHFHLVYRRRLIVCWLVALILDGVLVITYANDSQLRWGCAAVALVVAYLAGVQISEFSRVWLPKELLAGMIFVFGVSLNAWSEAGVSDFAALSAATLLGGLLFAANCAAIAAFEMELDASQNVSSFPIRFPRAASALPIALSIHALVTLALVLLGSLPSMVGGCLIAGSVLLFGLCVGRMIGACGGASKLGSDAWVGLSILMADVALVFPPIVLIIAGYLF